MHIIVGPYIKSFICFFKKLFSQRNKLFNSYLLVKSIDKRVSFEMIVDVTWSHEWDLHKSENNYFALFSSGYMIIILSDFHKYERMKCFKRYVCVGVCIYMYNIVLNSFK